MLGRLGLAVLLLSFSVAATAEEAGPQVEALAWRQVTYTGEADGAAYGGRLAVDFPLRVAHLPAGRMWTRLDLAGAGGQLSNFTDPTAFGKRIEVGIGWYAALGKIGHVALDDPKTSEDEAEDSWIVSTNLFFEGGWATVTGNGAGEDEERIEDRYLRHAVAGLLVVEETSGGYIGVALGKHELGGRGSRVQFFVLAQMPVPRTGGALVIGGTAVVNGNLRDVARIYVGADLFAVLGRRRED